MGTLSERNPSLWVGTTDPAPYAPLDGDTSADVVVIGAGIAGLTTARLLAAEGRRVAVVDAGSVCAGATGYTTAKVTSLHTLIYAQLEKSFDADTAAIYGAANEAAIHRIVELTANDEIDCELEQAAAYTYTLQAENLPDIEAEVNAATRAGLSAAFTTETDLPYDVLGAVRVDGQYQFHPRKYCLGLAQAIVRDGGSVHDHTRALEVDEDTHTVTTDRGTISAGDVVIASHQPFPLHGGYFARAEPWRSYVLALSVDGPRPEGMYISCDEQTRSVRSTAAGHVLVGGEGHKVGHDDDTEANYARLESWARETFPVTSVEYRWSAQDYKTPDGLPYIGRMTPGSDHVYVATGFRKWGMTNGTVAAMILADTIAGRENPWSSTFDSHRSSIAQSIKGLISENLDVAKRFIGDRIASLHPASIDDLSTGQGAIVDLDGEKVAAFRDDNGTVHAVSANCTHMGCRVNFNPAERSWDCPCHGSRFGIDGSVLEGPATKDLAPATPVRRM
ncbi:MAG TPA: FAD-dependent oxidoreductase [Acidimicrobiales bacterium]|nr:FAD-dependent oxidoreductase [Acidimicrobiales bacterium]